MRKGRKPTVGRTTKARIHTAVSTTRTGDAPVSTDKKFTEILRRSFFLMQPFQSGAPSLLPHQFQAQPCRRSRRVASTLCVIRDSVPALAETGSHPSDSTGWPLQRGSSEAKSCRCKEVILRKQCGFAMSSFKQESSDRGEKCQTE